MTPKRYSLKVDISISVTVDIEITENSPVDLYKLMKTKEDALELIKAMIEERGFQVWHGYSTVDIDTGEIPF